MSVLMVPVACQVCEWCGQQHDCRAICMKRPTWSRRGFLILIGSSVCGALSSGRHPHSLDIYGVDLSEWLQSARPMDWLPQEREIVTATIHQMSVDRTGHVYQDGRRIGVKKYLSAWEQSYLFTKP